MLESSDEGLEINPNLERNGRELSIIQQVYDGVRRLTEFVTDRADIVESVKKYWLYKRCRIIVRRNGGLYEVEIESPVMNLPRDYVLGDWDFPRHEESGIYRKELLKKGKK